MQKDVKELEMEIKQLYSDLKEAYRLEKELESNELWESYLASDPKLRKLLLRISFDSNMHRMFLEMLFKKLRKFSYEKGHKPPFQYTESRFRKLGTGGILKALRENENKVLEVYLRALHGPSGEAISKFWIGPNSKGYFDRLRWLVEQEKMHDRLLRRYLKGIEKPS